MTGYCVILTILLIGGTYWSGAAADDLPKCRCCLVSNLGFNSNPYKIWSKNYPTYAWGGNGVVNYYTAITTNYYEEYSIIIDGMYLNIVPGLTGECGTVSFQNPSTPTEYIRHYGYLLYLEDITGPRNTHIFDVDATFHVRRDHFYSGFVTFESVNYPGYFIRHQNYRLKIAQDDSSELFALDASFDPLP